MNVRRLSIGDLRPKRRHELNAVRTAWSTVRAHRSTGASARL